MLLYRIRTIKSLSTVIRVDLKNVQQVGWLAPYYASVEVWGEPRGQGGVGRTWVGERTSPYDRCGCGGHPAGSVCNPIKIVSQSSLSNCKSLT